MNAVKLIIGVSWVAGIFFIEQGIAPADVIPTVSLENGFCLAWDGALFRSTCQVERAESLSDTFLPGWQVLTNLVVAYPHMQFDVSSSGTAVFFRVCGHAETNSLRCNLRAYFPIDGNAQDASGYGNHGVVSNATLTTNMTGHADAAYRFNGSNALITGGNICNFSEAITVACWAMLAPSASLDKWHTVVSKAEGAGYGLEVDPAQDKWQWSAHIDGAYRVVRANDTVVPGTWCHLAGAYDGASVALYVNGIQQDDVIAITGLVSVSSVRLLMGANPGPNGTADNFLLGSLDDVRIYGRALASNEVETLYSKGPSGP